MTNRKQIHLWQNSNYLWQNSNSKAFAKIIFLQGAKITHTKSILHMVTHTVIPIL